MDSQLLFLCLLSASIHVISTLSYGLRITGVRTRRIALSLSLFNVLQLASRMSNTLLAPILSKRLEVDLVTGGGHPVADFRWLLVFAAVATAIAGVLIPSFQRFAVVSVGVYERKRSMFRLLFAVFGRRFWTALARSLTWPRPATIRQALRFDGLPPMVTAMNVVGIALISVGVFCALYAGTLQPELRVTATNLSAVVNFGGTMILFGFVDPHFSYLSDRVITGEVSESAFRRAVSTMATSRLLGTLLCQAILIPGAWAIVWVAKVIPA